MALNEYKNLLDYLLGEWGELVRDRVIFELNITLSRIQSSPEQFLVFLKRKKIRRFVASHQTSIYFKVNKNDIEIYAVFDNRRNPKILLKRPPANTNGLFNILNPSSTMTSHFDLNLNAAWQFKLHQRVNSL